MTEYAIACDMSALSARERVEHQTLMKIVTAAIRSQVELRDGYRFTLDTSVRIAEVGAWIALETRCCPFLRFAFELVPGASVTLELGGADGVKDFIVAELR